MNVSVDLGVKTKGIVLEEKNCTLKNTGTPVTCVELNWCMMYDGFGVIHKSLGK